ncbi:TPA: chromate efflux transporter [Pseudomonas aeruginosa]|jgi:chromate transporter|uniref:Chromate transport protein n=2 Tax=Pseudomonadota TaxID=1224 RepID=A0A6S7FF38_9BURK|nr:MULTISPECIES: chromate efflux transporter [Pseudomonadota]MCV4142766.1 chromate efflux transporter [Pseudomonas aeruginosa]MCV6495197.1 chromate efflux transporter [Pseudomonas aeruginosa]WCU08090.1 chromate efflux transporter [Pseudomonas aeruginosa]WEL96273.1 chromate efflux transporter [Delftia tsuruhatensis]WOB73160.1 chromate efflux transporter [Achromobacter xylosoxidans]
MTVPTTAERDSAWRVFLVFLRLGLTSFGGPIAHLGYFRTEFVERRRWLDDRGYSDLVALCQFLPGPASSQVGMALGLGRAGWSGLLAAWAGFTLPSAIALILFAFGIAQYQGLAASGWVHGLKVVAVAVVAQAVWGMAKSLCPDRPRAALAILAALLTLFLPSATGQVIAIVVAGLLGRWGLKLSQPAGGQPHAYPVSRKLGVVALLLFALPLVGLPLWAAASGSSVLALLEGVYRAGALVFGGGHVVLPLLQATVVPSGAVSNADFLAGYGAAQAVPGPLFTFAAYLGAVAQGPLHGWWGGLALLGVVFLPALLMLVGALPFWESLRHRQGIQTTMAGINAGVVGILLSALYDPVWTSAIQNRADFGLALAAFGLLVIGKAPPVLVVVLASAAGWVLAR